MSIAKGEVVVLKSGSPTMTVSELDDYSPMGPEKGAKCVWFDGSNSKEQIFDVEVLVKYTPPAIGARR